MLFRSDRTLFQPHPSGYRDSDRILKLATEDGARISAVYLRNEQARFTLLYSHGNAEDLGDMLPLLEELRHAGFSVFSYDYHGYGTSTGAPSEANTYRDIDAAYRYLTEELHIPPERIIAFGHSVGGGPTADLASRRPVAGLVLESSFTTAFRVLTRVPLVPFDKFRNLEKLKRVRCPVLIIHGRRDRVIPFAHGLKLYEAANPPKRSLWLDQADHDDVMFAGGTSYYDALRDFAASLAGRP